jgi:hypothetical protein
MVVNIRPGTMHSGSGGPSHPARMSRFARIALVLGTLWGAGSAAGSIAVTSTRPLEC